MNKNIPYLYKEYGKFINSSRAFPLGIDGLKPVERKILLSSYLIARDKFVKSARIDGNTIGNFHPHSSVYSTIVQLVNQGFLDGQGNFGTNVGVEPVDAAASRYTECKLSKFTKEFAFKLIDYVPWEINELEQKEPIYLPGMFPFCLLTKEYVQGIGFGYRTIIPCYKIEDLNKRLLYLLGKIKEKPIIKPITDCQILSTDNELEKLLTTGKASINFKGVIKVDPSHSKILLKSWPDGKRFESILNKISTELDNQDIGFTDLSTTETSIIFEVLKQRNRDDILKRVSKKIEDAVTGSISFEIIVADLNGNTRNISVDEMLLLTYNMYKETNIKMLKDEIEKISNNILENKLLEKLKPYISKYLKSSDQMDIIIKKISEESKVDQEKIKYLFGKYRISKLLTLNTDISDLLKNKENLEFCLKDIDNFVIKQYNNKEK